VIVIKGRAKIYARHVPNLARAVNKVVFHAIHHKHSSNNGFRPNFVARRKAPKSADISAETVVQRFSALSAHVSAQ
jgi:hypothetical protein